MYGANTFGASLGGGLDLRVLRHFSVRLTEAEYFATTFNNNSNDHVSLLKL